VTNFTRYVEYVFQPCGCQAPSKTSGQHNVQVCPEHGYPNRISAVVFWCRSCGVEVREGPRSRSSYCNDCAVRLKTTRGKVLAREARRRKREEERRQRPRDYGGEVFAQQRAWFNAVEELLERWTPPPVMETPLLDRIKQKQS
jgi:hypothetical protein